MQFYGGRVLECILLSNVELTIQIFSVRCGANTAWLMCIVFFSILVVCFYLMLCKLNLSYFLKGKAHDHLLFAYSPTANPQRASLGEYKKGLQLQLTRGLSFRLSGVFLESDKVPPTFYQSSHRVLLNWSVINWPSLLIHLLVQRHVTLQHEASWLLCYQKDSWWRVSIWLVLGWLHGFCLEHSCCRSMPVQYTPFSCRR